MAIEDFTTWTEDDADEILTVTATKVALLGTPVRWDGISKSISETKITGDFVHRSEVTITTLDNRVAYEIEKLKQSEGEMEIILIARASTAPSFSISLASEEVGDDTDTLTATGQKYYITMQRVGTTTTATIRTGSHDGEIVDALTITDSDVYEFDEIVCPATHPG